MVNKVILLGNLGADPEFKQLESTSVCNFSVATSERYNDKQGNKVENTEWHNVVLWGKLAEIASKYLNKGSKVYLEGRIKTEKSEVDGVAKYYTKIVCNTLKMLDSKASSNEVEVQEQASDLPF